MSVLNQAYDLLDDKIRKFGDARYDEGREPMTIARESEAALAEVHDAIEALIRTVNAQ